MDNSIVLALIRKDLDELHTLVEALEKEVTPNQLLIDISVAKAKTLYQEFSMLQGKSENPAVSTPPIAAVEQVHKLEKVVPATAPVPVIEEKPVVELVIEIPEEIAVPSNPASFEQVIEKPQQTVVEFRAETTPVISPEPEPVQKSEPLQEVKPQLFDSFSASPQTESPPIPQPQPETEPQVQSVDENESTSKKVLGERFTREASLNDRLSQGAVTEPRIKGKPVTSLKKAIGLNDKFMFTRELFGNDQNKFELSVDKLDHCTNLMEAIAYMEQNFHWTKNASSMKFIELVKKRFDE
jgi:hypothetical protein